MKYSGLHRCFGWSCLCRFLLTWRDEGLCFFDRARIPFFGRLSSSFYNEQKISYIQSNQIKRIPPPQFQDHRQLQNPPPAPDSCPQPPSADH